MMKCHFINYHVIIGLFAFFVFSACRKETSHDGIQTQDNLKLQFTAVVDGNPLVFGQTYNNAFSEPYSISSFKFYLHAIELVNTHANTIFEIDKTNHHLIVAGDSASSFLRLSVPSLTYNRIAFVIGVDSAKNVSGAQTDDLDPANGMFWTWSTGYIMAKLEGNSPAAATPNNVIEYHVGGFKGSESVLRKVILDLPALQTVEVKPGVQSTITIAANVNSWFSKTHRILISENPVSMTPGSLATQIADNYSGMFTVVEIVNE